MSGGHFEYQEYKIDEIAESIDHYIDGTGEEDESANACGFKPETLEELKTAIAILRKAYIYAKRIDYLLSGDDGEESFHRRLKEELSKL